MDMSAIPRIQSIVLTGLDFSMKPEHARFESSKGFIKPFPEIKVMHTIKTLAVLIYNQEKLTPYFHKNVCDGRNTLAYFICAVHRQSAPQPTSAARSPPASAPAEYMTSNTGSCKLPLAGKNCELPKLCTTSMLPLGYWDSLYYAVVSEIRMMRDDLEKLYGFGCELGNPVLHHHGIDGETEQPVTAVDLAQLLETAWYTLMDHRLVATLDGAVRMKNLREGAAREEINNAVKQFVIAINHDGRNASDREEDADWPPPVVPGLLDICGITPEVMFDVLWTKFKPEINQACLEDFEDESMLTAYRAELHAREVENAVAVSTPLPSATFCACHHGCLCKLKCDTETNECSCMNGRVRIYHLVRQQEARKNEIYTQYVQADQNVPNQFLGAATPMLAQMQIAALANPTAVNVEAVCKIHEANSEQELHIAKKLRERSDTNDSRLAYVPSLQPPHRAPKDLYPLDFYGGRSPQRYPRMPVQGAKSVTAEQPAHSILIPARKPLAATIPTKEPPFIGNTSQEMVTSIPSSQVTYPAVPKSRSQGMFIDSIPTVDTVNPRDIFPNSNDPANEYTCLLGRHPSTLEYGERVTEPFPALRRSQSPSPPNLAAVTVNMLPTLKTLNTVSETPQPEFHEPDFMAPRPALKQRYVSAGGNAKLSERTEIEGPALKANFPTNGGRITKEELDAKLNDPEWVRYHFGDVALRTSELMNPPRPSADSSKRSSARRSAESERGKQSGDKRDRTSSGASARIAKLKRVFSYKRSSSSDEETAGKATYF